MTSNNFTESTFTTQLREQIDYSKPGITRKTLATDPTTRFMLVCVTAGTTLPEHTASRNVSITVLEGRGTLTLKGRSITLEPGVFIYVPAHTPHALEAHENLAFLHT